MTASQPDRRLAAIMIVDMVGYTALSQRDEAVALARLAALRRILEAGLAAHGGALRKTMGDGALAEFPSALAAVRCAVALQRELATRRRAADGGGAPRLRIGIHLGEVIFEDGDVLGDVVNVTSRIEPLAEPGGICVSEPVADLVRQHLPYGTRRLRNPSMPGVSSELRVFRLDGFEALEADRPARPSWPRAQVALGLLAGLVMLGLTRLVGPGSGIAWLDPGRSVPLTEGRDASPEAPTPEGPTRASPVSVAVLPLAEPDAGPGASAFGAGLAEELVNVLGRAEGLRVMARSSTLALDAESLDPRRLGRELGVDYLLEGSVRVGADARRVVVRLVDTRDGFAIWSEAFHIDEDQLFKVQIEIAQAVATRLELGLQPADPSRLLGSGTQDSGAYEAFLLAQHFVEDAGSAGLAKATEYYQRAVDEDPGFARAHAGLARALALQGCCGREALPAATARRRAMEALDAALALEPDLATARSTLAFVLHRYDGDLAGAEQNYRRALAADPRDLATYHGYALLLDEQGRQVASQTMIETALSRDPHSVRLHRAAASIYARSGELDRAEWHREQARRLDPLPLRGSSSQVVNDDYF